MVLIERRANQIILQAIFLFLIPYYPLSSCQAFLPLISAPTGFLDLGLGNRWAQLLITSITVTYSVHQKLEVQLWQR